MQGQLYYQPNPTRIVLRSAQSWCSVLAETFSGRSPVHTGVGWPCRLASDTIRVSCQ